jgi:outer membrane protein OmpA-like peptidoglycan-associated protein
VLHRKNDSIARVVGLEPFVEYNLTFDETEFKNIAWRIDAKNVKVTTDPNQFKTIEVPVKPMGEMSGTVVDENNKGIARILINIDAENGQTERTVMSESDGFFSFLGLKPGNYTAKVDPKQLDALRMKANELSFQIKEDLNGDITDAGKIKLTYVSEKDSLEQNSELNKAAMKGLSSTSDSLQMLKRLNKFSDKNNPSPDILQKYDSLLKYIILFDFNSARVRSEFYGTIKQLGKLLQENPMLKLEIQGHTDNVGSDDVNIKFSERRANSVRKILVKYGIDESRLRIVGFGKRLPVPGNTNSTPKERSQNRRVVFKAISDKDVALIDSISRKNLN